MPPLLNRTPTVRCTTAGEDENTGVTTTTTANTTNVTSNRAPRAVVRMPR